METNRFKQDIEIEQLEAEYKEFKDGVQSICLVLAIVVIILQCTNHLF